MHQNVKPLSIVIQMAYFVHNTFQYNRRRPKYTPSISTEVVTSRHGKFSSLSVALIALPSIPF